MNPLLNPLAIKPAVILIGAAVLFAGGLGTGWTVNGWRLNAKVSGIKAEHAKQEAGQNKSALEEFQKTAETIKGAADQHLETIGVLGPKLDQISKELKNAKPLPVDCKPDAFRVRNLFQAIDATNEAAAR